MRISKFSIKYLHGYNFIIDRGGGSIEIIILLQGKKSSFLYVKRIRYILIFSV